MQHHVGKSDKKITFRYVCAAVGGGMEVSMRTTLKKMICGLIIFAMAITLFPQNVTVAEAATEIVYQYSTMLEENGSIYYIGSVEGDQPVYHIYQMEVSTGKKKELATSDNYISNMVIYQDNLYYTSYETDETSNTIYSVPLKGGEIQTVGTGYIIYADENGIFCTISDDAECKLYKRAYDGSEDTLIYTGNSTLNYAKNIDDTLYFSQYSKPSSMITLLSMKSSASKLTSQATSKVEDIISSIPIISDVVKVNGDLYYQYGTYEGSGNFWYGTIVKIETDTKKKKTIAIDVIEPSIFHNATKIFYDNSQSEYKQSVYNTKTEKTTSITLKFAASETHSIIGDKTYLAKPVSQKYISVSYFTSGTNKKNLKKDFIKFSYKQQSKLSYTAKVEKLGNYYLVSVVCIDFNDLDYGWRGKYLGVAWYVIDSKGKVLTTL